MSRDHRTDRMDWDDLTPILDGIEEIAREMKRDAAEQRRLRKMFHADQAGFDTTYYRKDHS